jgi:hypothetical protein
VSEAEKSTDSSPTAAQDNGKTGSEGNGQDHAAPPPPVSAPKETKTIERLTAMKGASASMDFIEVAGKDKTLKIRVDDRKSAVLMALSLLILLASIALVVLNPEAKSIGIYLVLVADALCGISIFWYCLLRFGFIRAIEPRYALLCWHLILGTGVFFSFIATNVMLFLFTMERINLNR